MFLGYEAETLSLFGFGTVSYIEVISDIGIAMMLMRIKQNRDSAKSKFEIRALRIIGSAFYLMSVGLIVSIVLNIVNYNKTETKPWE